MPAPQATEALAAPGTATPELGASVLQMLFGLAVVIALLFACLWLIRRLSAPRGWEVIRLPSGTTDQRAGTDLTALADAIRQVGLGTAEPPAELAVTRRKGHLAILADPAIRREAERFPFH